jgi:hypothetical protein
MTPPRSLRVLSFVSLLLACASGGCVGEPEDDAASESEDELAAPTAAQDLEAMAATYEHVHAFLTRQDGFVPDTLMLRRDGAYRFETAGECGECTRQVLEGRVKLTRSGQKRYLTLLGPTGSRARRFEYRREGEALLLLFATADWRTFARAPRGYCSSTADCEGQIDRGCRPRGLEDVASATCDAVAHACTCTYEPLFWLPERGKGRLVEGSLLVESDGLSNEHGGISGSAYACTRRDLFPKRSERIPAKAYVYWENDRLYVAPNFVPREQEARWAPGTATFRPDGGELTLVCDPDPLEITARTDSRSRSMAPACFEGSTSFEARSAAATFVVSQACTAVQYTPDRFWQATRPRKTTRRFTFTAERR